MPPEPAHVEVTARPNRSGRRRRTEVFVFGRVDVPADEPTRFYDPHDPVSVAVWRPYRRARVAAYRAAAASAVRDLLGIDPGRLKLTRDGFGARFVADFRSRETLWVHVKGGTSPRHHIEDPGGCANSPGEWPKPDLEVPTWPSVSAQH